MLIVPVIDLSKGVVVHAVKGNRSEYKAIASNLSSSAKPRDIINSFLEICAFEYIYIADLDALEKQGDNAEVIESLCLSYPNIEFWIDTGYSLVNHFLRLPNASNIRIILPSESLSSIEHFSALIEDHPQHRFILSLDFKSNQLLGPNDLLHSKQNWPNDIIVLNLNKVGSHQGFSVPAELEPSDLAISSNFFYGGGIRNLADINKLKELGFSGALISTALHTQTISKDDLCLLANSLKSPL